MEPATPSPGALAGLPGALAGLKVLDLTRVLGGPYATMILSDHGAEVIKVEPPQGDETRDWGPPFDAAHDASYFLGVNRNKRSIALDIGKPEGRAVVLRLLAEADVLVENFKPGGMERWGLGYGTLSAQFPRLIHCRVSGFGADGPLGGLPGYDAIVQAMVGLMTVNGTVAGPARIGTPVVDLATGLYSVIAILMALQERHRSGLGQFLDMTLHDCGMALLHPSAANYLLSGTPPKGIGNAHTNIAPYDTFATATCGMFVAIGNDAQFRKLAHEIGRPELAGDSRFTTNADRVINRGALTAILAEAFAPADGHALAVRLAQAGLPAGPVLGVDEAVAAPHTAARNMVVEAGGVRALGTPIKLSRTPGGMRTRPPRFGEHGGAILAEAGYSEEEVAALRAAGVLYDARR
jgi:crotonobetainyl-CoA:carnitine CoA-transferase CaiB-like acyl-CoA transferase